LRFRAPGAVNHNKYDRYQTSGRKYRLEFENMGPSDSLFSIMKGLAEDGWKPAILAFRRQPR
jgi:hypothetical protein